MASLTSITYSDFDDTRTGYARNPSPSFGRCEYFSGVNAAGNADSMIRNSNTNIQKKSGYSQTSFSFSAGLSYAFSSKLAARLDVGIQKLQGSDSKKGGAHPGRNLSFKSNVFDFAVSGEYTILNLDNFLLSPYVSAGIGVMLFNPYANDAAGKKHSLPELGTEGQGLAGYPGMYSTAALEFPLGIGVKYPFNERLTLALDFNHLIGKNLLL